MFSINVFLTRWSLRPKRWGQNWQRKSLLPVWTTRCLRTSLRVKKRRSQWSHRNLRSAGLFTVLDPVCTWIHKLQNYMLITFSALLMYILQEPITWPWALKVDYSRHNVLLRQWMLTKPNARDTQINGGHLNCKSFSEYNELLIPILKGYIHTYIHIPWIRKCVMKTVECGTSHNTHIYIYSVKYLKHFTKIL